MTNDLVSRAKSVLSPVLHHFTELEVVKGKGVYLIAKDGKKYLDFTSGIAVTNVGHCHPKVVAFAERQIESLIHACAGIVFYEANVALAEKLKSITGEGLDMAFFCQSGSEAVEAAIKLAKYVTKKTGIIAFEGGFHGRTLGSLSITTSKSKYREGYEPLLPNVYISPYPYYFKTKEKPEEASKRCLKEFEETLKKKKDAIALVIVEPVQGEGGYIVPPLSFIKGLREICRKYKILIAFDEVQSGFGRCGKLFAFEYFGVIPDILIMAKALASGFPLGAILASEKIMTEWKPGAHGSTMSGNPVSCAAALATIEVIESEGLIKNSEEMGNCLKGKLIELRNSYPIILDVRGLGLMIGVEFANSEIVVKIREECLKRELILISCGREDQVIRFIPPLIVEKSEIDEALKIFEEALKAVSE